MLNFLNYSLHDLSDMSILIRCLNKYKKNFRFRYWSQLVSTIYLWILNEIQRAAGPLNFEENCTSGIINK